MIRRLMLVAGAISGGAVLSQAPEFTQQYRQNLNGQVAELNRNVETFRSDAIAEGKTIDQALDELRRGTSLAQRRAERNAENFERLDRLSAHEQRLENSTPGLRTVALARSLDAEVAERAIEKFQPALPLTFEGGLHAAIGAAVGWVLFWLILGGLGVFAGRRASRAEWR
ncbi:MAG: DUF2937 family protein [Pseudomonadota bacterium]